MLTINTVFKGIAVTNASAAVGVINIAEDRAVMSFVVNYRAPGCEDIFDQESFSCDYDLNGGSPESQAYAYLSTVEKFKV